MPAVPLEEEVLECPVPGLGCDGPITIYLDREVSGPPEWISTDFRYVG
jgi:hypothetical protein